MDLKDEIRRITEEIVKNLSGIKLFDKSDKKRFEDVLYELRRKGEIINFLPNPSDRRFKDFVVIVENKGKYDTIGIAIKKRKEEIERYIKKQDQLREQISKYRKFIERFVFTVNSRTTDKELEKQFKNTLKEYKES